MNFWNDEKEEIEEKCPDCNEEFLNWKGGAQCISNYCQGKQLEEEHRQVVKPMVDYCLPKYRKEGGIKVETPNNLSAWEIRRGKGWGWTDYPNKTITIPWYTLRSKKEFFDTTTHEAAHIKSRELTTTYREKEIIKTYGKLWKTYERNPNYEIEKTLFDYQQKHKKIIRKYQENSHIGDPWWLAYKRFHQRLMGKYSQYNYYNRPPQNQGFSLENGKVKGKYEYD